MRSNIAAECFSSCFVISISEVSQTSQTTSAQTFHVSEQLPQSSTYKMPPSKPVKIPPETAIVFIGLTFLIFGFADMLAQPYRDIMIASWSVGVASISLLFATFPSEDSLGNPIPLLISTLSCFLVCFVVGIYGLCQPRKAVRQPNQVQRRPRPLVRRTHQHQRDYPPVDEQPQVLVERALIDQGQATPLPAHAPQLDQAQAAIEAVPVVQDQAQLLPPDPLPQQLETLVLAGPVPQARNRQNPHGFRYGRHHNLTRYRITAVSGRLRLGGHYHLFPTRLLTEHVEATIRVERVKDEDQLNCPICWEEFEHSPLVSKMPCEHLVHTECAKRSLEMHLRCPLCQQQLEWRLALPGKVSQPE
jgi:hypothetical protein